MWSSCPCVIKNPFIFARFSRRYDISGMTMSMPGISSSGKLNPQSTMTMSLLYSTTVMFLPISPTPPSGMIFSLFAMLFPRFPFVFPFLSQYHFCVIPRRKSIFAVSFPLTHKETAARLFAYKIEYSVFLSALQSQIRRNAEFSSYESLLCLARPIASTVKVVAAIGGVKSARAPGFIACTASKRHYVCRQQAVSVVQHIVSVADYAVGYRLC